MISKSKLACANWRCLQNWCSFAPEPRLRVTVVGAWRRIRMPFFSLSVRYLFLSSKRWSYDKTRCSQIRPLSLIPSQLWRFGRAYSVASLRDEICGTDRSGTNSIVDDKYRLMKYQRTQAIHLSLELTPSPETIKKHKKKSTVQTGQHQKEIY
jgi:hypothetical protein